MACHKAVYCGRKHEYGRLEDSIIIFGGYDYLKEPQNILYQIKLKKSKAVVLKLTTRGIPPPPRYLHGMAILEEGKIFSKFFSSKFFLPNF